MNRSTLLLFLCVFAVSEVLLAAKKVRIDGVARVKNSNNMRLVRSTNCPNDTQCEELCKFRGASGGSQSDDDDKYCDCDGNLEPANESICVKACTILGFGFVKMHGDDCGCEQSEC
ncbi:hypothetical protein Ddc_19187 [Ditylenchus destructor]|nr:hypothetical protein Ddc_19187 [Ditylenchus destructor]